MKLLKINSYDYDYDIFNGWILTFDFYGYVFLLSFGSY